MDEPWHEQGRYDPDSQICAPVVPSAHAQATLAPLTHALPPLGGEEHAMSAINTANTTPAALTCPDPPNAFIEDTPR